MFKLISMLVGLYALAEAVLRQVHFLETFDIWTRFERNAIRSDINEYLVFAFAAFAVTAILNAIDKKRG